MGVLLRDSAGTMGLRYTWGPGSDNLLAIEDESGNHYYATTDRLGSIRTLATRNGTWLLTRRWDPYGNEISRDSSASFTWGRRLRYGWTGREYDVELGMYYHRARYYSQSLRRFIQEDPVEGSTSPYAYVHGSPLEATDPSGMMDSWEMLRPDPREAQLTMAQGPSTTIAGVSYDGHGLWLDGLGAGGGAQIQQINVFGTGTTLTQSECRRPRPGCVRGSMPLAAGSPERLGVESEFHARGINGITPPPAACGCDILSITTYDPLTAAQISAIETSRSDLAETVGLVAGATIFGYYPALGVGAIFGYGSNHMGGTGLKPGDRITVYYTANYPLSRGDEPMSNESTRVYIQSSDGTVRRSGWDLPF